MKLGVNVTRLVREPGSDRMKRRNRAKEEGKLNSLMK